MAANSKAFYEPGIRAADGRQWLAKLFTTFQRHPIASAAAIVAADVTFITLSNLVAKTWLPMIQPPDFLALSVDTALIAVILTVLGWWRVAGFNRPAEWRELRLLWLPALLALVVPFAKGMRPMDAAAAAYLVLAYVLTGLREEALYRGIVLRVLRPIGAARAVLLMSVLFGSAHLVNLLVRANPYLVFAQVVGAFSFGVAMGALRLRTNTIWWLIALHALSDLFLRFTRLPAIPLEVARDTILLCYGLYLLRNQWGPERA